MTLSQTNGFAAVFGDVRVPDAQPSRVGATAATSSAAAASHRLHFVDHDLTKRQRALLVVSVFVTALLVTYLTGIRPGKGMWWGGWGVHFGKQHS